MNKSELQKQTLKNIIINLLNTNISIMEFGKLLTKEEKEIRFYKKAIRHSKKAIELVQGIEHIEILSSLYNSFISGKEAYFITLEVVISKNVQKWDKTKKGFEEFLRLDEEARNKFKQEADERNKSMETIKKAREEGKKVEMVFENGKITPVVVEEPLN